MFSARPSRLGCHAPFAAVRVGLVLTVLSGTLSVAAPLAAQELDDATRSAARALAVEGSELYAAQDFAGAQDRFDRAYQLVHAPTLGIWSARSLVKLGRWLEASERMLDVQRQPIAEGAPPEHQKAQADAIVERQALLARIPTLRVVLAGAAPAEVFVTLNGELLPAALIGVGRPVNPGQLAIKATRGEQVQETSIELHEGETRDVTLTFAAPRPVTNTPAALPLRAVPMPPAGDESGPDTQRTLGYVALGAGGVGLAVGSIFGLLGLSQKSDLEAACPARRCAASEYDRLDAYEAKRTVSTIGFVAGALFGATGAVLLLSAPDAPSASNASNGAGFPRSARHAGVSARVGLFVGLGQAGLVGALP